LRWRRRRGGGSRDAGDLISHIPSRTTADRTALTAAASAPVDDDDDASELARINHAGTSVMTDDRASPA